MEKMEVSKVHGTNGQKKDISAENADGKNNFYMDGYLKNNLDTAKKAIKADWDMLFCVDGSEGSGKSTLAIQMAKYCDPTLTNKQVVFTPHQFSQAVITAKKNQAVVYDEAYTGLSSRATMSLINRTLISMLAEIRQRNLFIFVVMPTFFDLDKYVALWRSRALIHVYCGDNFQRGRFAFFNVDRKKDLYINGKKYYSYGKPKANFIGKFTSAFPIEKKEYLNNKKNSLLEREKKREQQQIRKELEAELLDRVMRIDHPKITHAIKADILGLKLATYYNRLSDWRKKEEEDSI